MTNTQSPIVSETDETLVGRIAQSDTLAFDEIYRRYSNRLLHYFYRMLGGNESLAQDLLQETCIRLIEKAYTFREDGKFSTWLFTIAHNLCLNTFRANKKFGGSVTDHSGSDTLKEYPAWDDQIDHDRFMRSLHKELVGIDEKKRSVFLLRFQEHHSIREISKIMDCPEGTVKSRLFHTTRYLSGRLRDYKEI
ncbi:sigma-70 family RNA polymerase sigma factor [candidate division KSB1 bacterium]|nr:sigma-70 family RNA polymerase sigma factor [candidate division KSB1 bacterium]